MEDEAKKRLKGLDQARGKTGQVIETGTMGSVIDSSVGWDLGNGGLAGVEGWWLVVGGVRSVRRLCNVTV